MTGREGKVEMHGKEGREGRRGWMERGREGGEVPYLVDKSVLGQRHEVLHALSKSLLSLYVIMLTNIRSLEIKSNLPLSLPLSLPPSSFGKIDWYEPKPPSLPHPLPPSLLPLPPPRSIGGWP